MLEKILGYMRIIAAPVAMAAAGMAPAYADMYDECPPAQCCTAQHTLPDWRLAFDMTEIHACQAAKNSLGDCVLALVEPDKNFLKNYCGGTDPFGYEIRAGDKDSTSPQEPTVVVFCNAEDYSEAQATGEVARQDPIIDEILPILTDPDILHPR